MKRKKIIGILLSSCMLAAVVLPQQVVEATEIRGEQITELTKVAAKADTSEYKKGAIIEGFKVIGTEYNNGLQCDVISFEHVKTGAALVWFKNKDLNRGFSIGFDSPAENNKGINHIMEHSLISSSKKYPDKNLFFTVMSNTYTSFINAFTYQNMTVYPVTSASEDQLKKLVDIYMDCMYNPSILTEEKIFEREAWRYEIESADGDIGINGTVYNEMRGNYADINTVAYYNAQKTIFQHTNQGYASGGDPEEIQKLTYKDFVKTYTKYYHPSNSLMTLYGDLDCTSFLKLIDKDYLSKYERRIMKQERIVSQPVKKLVEKTFDFPAAEGVDTKNKAIIDYVTAGDDLEKMGIEEYAGLSIVAACLNADTSPFKQALIKSGIATSYSVSVTLGTYQPVIRIMAKNADASRSKEFYNLVQTELKKIVKNNFDTELVNSLMNSLRFETILGKEGQVGLNTMTTAQLMNNLIGNPTANLIESFYKIEDKLGSRYLESLVEKYIVNNKREALVTTKPKAGLLEKKEAEQKKKLELLKGSKSDKEIKAMIQKTTDFNTWNSQESDPAVIESLKAIKVKDLPTEVRDYKVTKTTEQGAAILTTTAEVEDISETAIIFKEEHLDLEELSYLQFYMNMLSMGIPTETKSEKEIVNNLIGNTYNLKLETKAIKKDYKKKDAVPVAQIHFYAMNEDYITVLNLISDMLLHSKLENCTEYMNRTINQLKTTYMELFSNPLNLILSNAAAYTSEEYQYSSYLSGMGYYNFILDLEKQIAGNPDKVVKRLKEVREKAFIKKGLTILCAGDNNSAKQLKSGKRAFVSAFSDKEYEKASYELPKPERREAWTTNTTVQYVAYNADLQKAGIDYNGDMSVLTTLLDGMLLLPEIRYKGGAYGAASMISTQNLLMYSYRDNNFVNSLAVMGGTGEFVETLLKSGFTDANLESYILSAFASNSVPAGDLTEAYKTLMYYFMNYSAKDREKALKEIKNIKASDLKEYAKMLQKLNETANYIVIASPDKIDQNKDLFDKVIPIQ